jgi:hypothetical protein
VDDGAWCDPALFGADCVGGTCTNRTNLLAFELEGDKTTSPAGACCNDTNGTCTQRLPWDCAGDGDTFIGGSCPGTCGLGACCDPADGTCEVMALNDCPGGLANFLGFGTDCEPNCCQQPVMTGGNNCEDVMVHEIVVPGVGDPPVVVTISGDKSGASGPDSCLQGAWYAGGGTVLTVDPGWWEGFRLLGSNCANVRVDWCCSEPTIEPQWSFLWKGCPCDDPRFTSIDPNNPSEAAFSRGSPYCSDYGDDNLWLKYFVLRTKDDQGDPITYYQPVYSQLQGLNTGAYQMHITVSACPDAACCDGETCHDVNQLGCADIDGANFLAPPFRTTPTTSCQLATCLTGSCCYSPTAGLCTDTLPEGLMTKSGCDSLQGIYKGGARCRGCVCNAGTPPASCSDDSHCTGGASCINPTGGTACSGQNRSQPSPCPVCEFENSANCQRHNATGGSALSDLCVSNCVTSTEVLGSARVADDFVASATDDITSVCIVGRYYQQPNDDGLAVGSDCSPSGPPEIFKVTVYSDAGGVPGTQIGTSTTSIIRKENRWRHDRPFPMATAPCVPDSGGAGFDLLA